MDKVKCTTSTVKTYTWECPDCMVEHRIEENALFGGMAKCDECGENFELDIDDEQ